MATNTFHYRWPAMACWFEAWLVGSNFQHLEAVAHQIAAEVRRLEQRLSRFDPASELSRINRHAAEQPVLVDFEMQGILLRCFEWWQKTGGHFDIAATSASPERPATLADVEFDATSRRLRFVHPRVQLDLGGFGKGYALDRCSKLLDEFGVASALIHAGTSSVMARGANADGEPWQVGIFNPWDPREEPSHPQSELDQVTLVDQALSCSAVRHPQTVESDLIDPLSGQPLAGQGGCVVLAPDAADAEALSTGLLCMGKDRARRYTEEELDTGCRVAWIDRLAEAPRLQWWTPHD